jgi:hypothetical protein
MVMSRQQLNPGVRYTAGPIEVFLHDETMRCLKARFDYLTSSPVYLNKELNILERPVSYLDYHVSHTSLLLYVLVAKLLTHWCRSSMWTRSS